ncbi:hypothetical protein Golax_000774 [Gossypium laxum]|uniref:Uncharacterized protein n=1 Tax=Gossypium laxum TaxID=34288 RepID=A0A7J9AUU2_9ROSI|nr:hypothetical protein [Gossypium laxum]
MIRGYLILDLSRNLVHLMWLLKLVYFRATSELTSYVGIPITLEDIRLLLDQRSEAHSRCTRWIECYDNLDSYN